MHSLPVLITIATTGTDTSRVVTITKRILHHVVMNLTIGALLLFATCRVNRLVVKDSITQPIRTWAEKQTRAPARYLAELITCVWCTSMWTAATLTTYTHHIMQWNWHLLPLTILAVAWLAPILTQWLEE